MLVRWEVCALAPERRTSWSQVIGASLQGCAARAGIEGPDYYPESRELRHRLRIVDKERNRYARLRAAALPKVNLYSLRRMMASIVHALGVPPKVMPRAWGTRTRRRSSSTTSGSSRPRIVAAAEGLVAAIREARPIDHRQAEGDC